MIVAYLCVVNPRNTTTLGIYISNKFQYILWFLRMDFN